MPNGARTGSVWADSPGVTVVSAALASACVSMLAKGVPACAAAGACAGVLDGAPGVADGSAERQLGGRVIEQEPFRGQNGPRLPWHG